jgi:2,3-bisphosphoglycerate-dependent phosphoglycerate mutase
MRSFARVALLLCLSGALFAQNAGSIFIVRHAEKQSDAENSAISARGKTRADCLARTLHDARIATVIHSQYIRTAQTAAPLMRETHPAEVTVPAKSYDQIAAAARNAAQSGNVLIVGHSNTIPTLLTTLGAPGVNIPDAAYDFLFIVDTRDPKRTTVLHYCTELPASDSAGKNSMAK